MLNADETKQLNCLVYIKNFRTKLIIVKKRIRPILKKSYKNDNIMIQNDHYHTIHYVPFKKVFVLHMKFIDWPDFIQFGYLIQETNVDFFLNFLIK